MMELSHSVDDIVDLNLRGLKNVDVIQCSIDAPPLKDCSINGIVYCHNVIQHTESVEKTAKALFSLLEKQGEFVFNCYGLNDKGVLRWIRFHLIYTPLRYILSKTNFKVVLLYSNIISILRFIPFFGKLLEKSLFCFKGDVPGIENEKVWRKIVRHYKTTVLGTYDAFGTHHYNHHKSDSEIINLIESLQPNTRKVLNREKYFSRPQPIATGLRIFK